LPAYLPSRTNEYPNTNTPSKLPVEITELEGRKIIEKARGKKMESSQKEGNQTIIRVILHLDC
jgi:hypothetical protein